MSMFYTAFWFSKPQDDTITQGITLDATTKNSGLSQDDTNFGQFTFLSP